MREWRVGRITLGILFLAVGVVLLTKLFVDIDLWTAVKYGVPLILILLGLEVLIFTIFAKGEVKFGIISIIAILVILTIIFGLGFAYLNSPFVSFNVFSGAHSVDVEKLPTANWSRYKIGIDEEIKLPAGTSANAVNKVTVDFTNGNLEVVGTKTDKIKLTGTISVIAENQQAAEAKIAESLTTKVAGNELVISYGDDDNDYSSGIDASILLSKAVTTLSLKLEVPEQLLVSGDLVNGNITVENVFGELDLEVVNGRIDVKLDKLAADIDVDTVNGRINLTLPANSDALINAKTDIGSVDGNIKWVVVSSVNRVIVAEKTAKLGNGLYKIELTTITGSIFVDTPAQPMLH